MDANLFTSILFATVVAGTPLIIVALGLLVSEKAGVLNLGADVFIHYRLRLRRRGA